MGARVLLVEDDEDIADILGIYLRMEGLDVRVAADTEAAFMQFEQHSPDLLLTDIILPDGTGLELAKHIRGLTDIPIIFISCKKEPQEVIEGLKLGGDDYITKPFEPSVVVARVCAQLRRFQMGAQVPKPAERIWADTRLDINPHSLEVKVAGSLLALYAKERQLLLFMAEHPNQVFSVEQLYEQVWGWEKDSDLRTVMVHIRNLRKKIEEEPDAPRYIVTVRGFGYKFCWAHG